MYRLLSSVFDTLDTGLDALRDGVRGGWRRLRDGVLQDLIFGLALGLTGLRLLVEDLLGDLDRVLAWLERATIAVLMLAMVGLSFLDYLKREVPALGLELEGGPNLAMIAMVWVGFLGASLATKLGKHLATDASDKLLSPGAARVTQRLSALIAAGLCWQLMGYAWTLTSEGVEFADTLEGLVLWPSLAGPLAALVALLPVAGSAVAWGPLLLAAGLSFGALRVADRLGAQPGLPGRLGAPLAEAVGALAGGVALLRALPLVWEPRLEFDVLSAWPAVEAGAGFPIWIAQLILPASFAVMALRFAAAGLLGVKPPPDPEAPVEPFTFPHPGGLRTGRDVVFAGLFPGLLLGVGATLYFGTGGLILAVCILLVLIGAPLFVAIGVGALASVMLVADLGGVSVATDMFEATKKQELLSIPFFVLAGNIMTQGSLSERLVGVARAVLGRTPGGLGLASVFACTIFAAISGSSPVTVIAIGALMFPMLTRDRYPEGYSMGVLTTAGSLGIIIPPSIPMIIYAIMTSTPEAPVSPNDLFLAGVLPGLFIASMLAVYTLYRTRPRGRPDDVPVPVLEGGYWPNLGRALRRGALALALPVLILGGIYGLLGPLRFTVTEAAAVAVVYALVVEVFVHRELGLRKLVDVLVESGVMMGSLFLIIVLAIAFNRFLTFQQIPQEATAWMAERVSDPLSFLIMANLFLLVLGCLMEIISAILIVAPLLAPMAAQYGIDPIHFGIIFIVNLELGYLTPPMGINLFVASTVFRRSLGQVIRSVLPFLFIMLFCLVVITLTPWLSLALLGLGGE